MHYSRKGHFREKKSQPRHNDSICLRGGDSSDLSPRERKRRKCFFNPASVYSLCLPIRGLSAIPGPFTLVHSYGSNPRCCCCSRTKRLCTNGAQGEWIKKRKKKRQATTTSEFLRGRDQAGEIRQRKAKGTTSLSHFFSFTFSHGTVVVWLYFLLFSSFLPFLRP